MDRNPIERSAATSREVHDARGETPCAQNTHSQLAAIRRRFVGLAGQPAAVNKHDRIIRHFAGMR